MTSKSFPSADYTARARELDQAVERVVRSGYYILGEEVERFEEEFAAYLGVESVVAVASGTDAIEIALRANDIGPGDQIVTVSHTAVGTVAAIEATGAEVVLADIDRDTFTIDPMSLQRVLEDPSATNVRAVIPVHLYGHPVDLSVTKDLATRYGIAVIEDCAQAAGAGIDGIKLGTTSEAAAFSFYPTKNLAAMGDAGAVATDRKKATSARALRQYGWEQRYISTRPGLNSRMDELQAAILRVKLPYLDETNKRRIALSQIYDDILAGSVTTPVTHVGCTHVFHQYVITTDRRDELAAHLAAEGFSTAIHYPVPIHLQPAYVGRLLVDPEGLPVTKHVVSRILSLPIHPHLQDEEVKRIAGTVVDWVRKVAH